MLLKSVGNAVRVKTSILALALAIVGAAPSAVVAQQEAGEAEVTLNCDMLDHEQGEAPVQWLTYSLWASHCYSFQARAVAIDTFNVRTLALSHRIKDGVRQQVVQHLDGPSVNVERRAQVGHWGWLDAGVSGDQAPMPERWAEHVASAYDISLQTDKRVADRDAVELTFLPKKGDRYRHKWWLDRATGLLLKHVLRDTDGTILETFQVTRLQTPERYTDNVKVVRPESAETPAWKVDWLPEGMVQQPSSVRQVPEGRTHRMYSDGLATVSVFVESPVVSTGLATGVHKLGASAIAVERHRAPKPWQVIAIGEVPPELLGRIARSVTYTQK